MLALATKKAATKPWTLHGSREIQGQGRAGAELRQLLEQTSQPGVVLMG